MLLICECFDDPKWLVVVNIVASVCILESDKYVFNDWFEVLILGNPFDVTWI